MIFVVTGTQAPFDRLIKTVDDWAKESNVADIYAQIADAGYTPKNLQWSKFLSSKDFNKKFSRADLIISHAGMGTIISALVLNKPILVMPRIARFKEHRNDHQVDTAKSFEKLNMVHVAYDETQLLQKLNNHHNLGSLAKISKYASKRLLEEIENFISKGYK